MPFNHRTRSLPVSRIFARDPRSYTPQVDDNARNSSLSLAESGAAPGCDDGDTAVSFCGVVGMTIWSDYNEGNVGSRLAGLWNLHGASIALKEKL
jgi:hypothetical protein